MSTVNMAMKTVRMTMAQALVRFLNQQYVAIDGQEVAFVHGVMTIFGHGNVLGIGQALEENPGHLQVHQGCNEQGMAHMAIGFAKQYRRQRIYAVSSSIGPGAANMVTAAATATANRIPLLLLPGDIYASRQPDPVLQQIEQYHDLSISTNDCFRPVSRYWDRINRPEQLMSAMLSAMRVLTDPADTGAVTLCLPQDVQGEAWDYPASFFERRVHRIERRPPDTRRLSDALSLIARKRRPLVVCGGGVRYSGAHEAFRAFVENAQLPFTETQAGKGALPSDHPLNLGGIGVTGGLAANRLAPQADLVIGIGTRLTDFTTGSKALFSHPEVAFLLLNVAEFDALKLDATALIADARVGLEALTEGLTGYRTAWQGDIIEAKAAWRDECQRLWSRTWRPDEVPEVAGHLDDSLQEYAEVLNTTLTQTRVLGLINQHIEDDAIVVGAAGSLPGDLQRLWQVKTADTYHLEYGYSCMGYEIAAAIGAKIAMPHQPVYAMVGDGSYMMLHSELHTAVQEGLKITVLLFDNAGFGCINNLQMGHGMSSFCTESRHRNHESGQLNGPLIRVDFAQNAESYGCRAWRVHDEPSLLAALAASRDHPGPVLLDIKVLPKSMTHDYASWWRTGDAQIARSPAVQQAAERTQMKVKRARQY
ncbi:3D-(3,5/4)-trihydroxycyclohexane-1,2-dione acylhydrolase (decyclizing) [Yersinia pseudotuberculosis]|uniref:Thiamine pyrophosphate protein domain protein TPP-binding n=2 Tax=Yersinia pseudotuberculosis TaxID=633 RepID=A0A0H3B5A4_YERPY|nr:3D-(3,5/4)-trihydroxycyclohexane-1,2-dione acylhydrolase (decyclizing) [Yersinia pseudotuberculosis]AYW99678.1 3D-(3,5/4)-trihydroxycyclohexane-1,2-dione acylhydrolase (decyclizing) [Yersinia pseudotuberculosis]AZA31241.1 3D-(3,5/4)-trihydroxycyclohexane-1,2-dione acylhydrolase (decyclizing) [Yersinia pseudotuberculosis]SQA50369.1 thiamine pyrophosphate-dependent protein [Yersinia pseudotuberculosis]